MIRSSFRDPDGSLHLFGNRVFRSVRRTAGRALEAETLEPFRRDGTLVGHRLLRPEDVPAAVRERGAESDLWLEHPAVPFPTYPAEWTWGMLRRAALLTLDLAASAARAGLRLKDATPWNILFQGPEPVFIDALSFAPQDPGDPTWPPLTQFIRTFLLPLLLNRDKGFELARAFQGRDGLPLEEARRLAPWAALGDPYRTWVTLPLLLQRLDWKLPKPALPADDARALQLRLLARLRRTVADLARPRAESAWTGYQANRTYTPQGLAAKAAFCQAELLKHPRGAWMLDLGANTGEYSLMADAAGCQVVAVDADENCMDALWRRSRAEHRRVLPMVLDLGNPTPAGGWMSSETPAFMTRARQRFDLVLAFALTHHLRFAQGVPFRLQSDALAHLARGRLLVEYVAPEDPMVQAMVSRFGYLPEDYSMEAFEAALARNFKVTARRSLDDGKRWLYAAGRLG